MTVNNAEMYIAGWVVRKAFSRLSCNKCRWALVTEERPADFTDAYHLLQVKGSPAHYVPANGTIRAVMAAEKAVRRMLIRGVSSCRMCVLTLQHSVLLTLGSEDVFHLREHIADTELGLDNHHFQLLRSITAIYYELRKSYIEKTATANRQRTRAKLTLTRPL